MKTNMTIEHRLKLEKNKYIRKISPKGQVHFTPKFIEHFFAERNKGRPSRSIFEGCGLGAVCTTSRIKNLVKDYQNRDFAQLKKGRKYTEAQQKKLRALSNVSSCTAKNIIYSSNFKKQAVQQYQQGMPLVDIWEHAGFGFLRMNSPQLDGTLRNWLIKVKKNNGNLDALDQTRGNKKKERRPQNMSLEEENAYLKSEVLYLKELQSLVQARIKRENRKNSGRSSK